MPEPQPAVTLRVEPQALQSIKAVFEESIAELRLQVQRLGSSAFIPEPWMGDQVSSAMQTHYNAVVMEAPDGAYAAITEYVNSLIAIRDSLKAMEAQYLATEAEIARGLGRQA
ncbi:hypothetical protein [Pseudonocardia zijingensis]|jgi:hypothetical protein|uniref:PE family protein n=1 Tax=Pseudonocardia zijingensis TaxID=153376 RepID=A0ABP3YTF6_9PSEU